MSSREELLKMLFHSAIARAPGKVILTGEHFVVLGAPAISMAVNLYSQAKVTPINGKDLVEVDATVPLHLTGAQAIGESIEPNRVLEPLRTAARAVLDRTGHHDTGLRVETECGIPIGAGLGSSASTSVAIIAAVAASFNATLGKEDIFRLAFEPERLVHTKPSGVDQAAATYGGTIEYRATGKIGSIKTRHQPCILVCDTGIHRSTGRLVGNVVKRSERETERFHDHIKEAQQISLDARRALENGDDEKLGQLMNRNQELLSEIGVSHPALERLIRAARHGGALGAKLTGAGGGGCMIALCKNEISRRLLAGNLKRLGGTPYLLRVSKLGVTVRSRQEWTLVCEHSNTNAQTRDQA